MRLKPGTLDGVWPKHFDTLAYDQRGLGQTSKPDRPYTMAEYADDAAGLMRAIGWQSARVIGVSFGGMVAQELVLRHPAMVERLALACTSPGGAGGASYPLHTLQHLSAAERAKHMVPISDTRHDAAWAKTHPDEYRMLTTMADPFANEPGRAIGAAHQIEARAHHDTWDRLLANHLPGFDRGRPLRRHGIARNAGEDGAAHSGRASFKCSRAGTAS